MSILNRRHFLAGTSTLLAAPAILRAPPARAQGVPIRVGLVTPRTGPLVFFCRTTRFHAESVPRCAVRGRERSPHRDHRQGQPIQCVACGGGGGRAYPARRGVDASG